MQKTILFHDGCNICLPIEAAFKKLFWQWVGRL